MQDKLKRCPHCGLKKWGVVNMGGWVVVCHAPKCRGSLLPFLFPYETREEAIAA